MTDAGFTRFLPDARQGGVCGHPINRNGKEQVASA